MYSNAATRGKMGFTPPSPISVGKPPATKSAATTSSGFRISSEEGTSLIYFSHRFIMPLCCGLISEHTSSHRDYCRHCAVLRPTFLHFKPAESQKKHPRVVRDVCPLADHRAPDGGVSHAAASGDESVSTCGMTSKEDKKTPARVEQEPWLILGGRPSLAGGVLCIDFVHLATDLGSLSLCILIQNLFS